MESDKEIISRLKFIGKIRKGDKINVKYMFIQPDGILTSISRTLFNQDNRQNTLNFVRRTITRSYEILNDRFLHKYVYENIVIDLKQASTGLLNLKDTYMDDIKFTCDIDTLLQEIHSKINDEELSDRNKTETRSILINNDTSSHETKFNTPFSYNSNITKSPPVKNTPSSSP